MSENRRFLEGFNICLTSLSKEDLSRAQSIISHSGGTHSPAVIDITGCIITGSVNDKHYQAAQKSKKIACVTIKWLYDTYKETKLEPDKRRKLPLPLEDYPVPAFLGLTVTCTQVTPEERKEIEGLVKANRGTYSAELIKGTCTHLVCLKGDMVGSEKYRSARRWGMFTVSVKWIKDCVSQRRWMPEHNYLVIPEDKPTNKPDKPHPAKTDNLKPDAPSNSSNTSGVSNAVPASSAAADMPTETPIVQPPAPPPPPKPVNLTEEINAYLSCLPVSGLPSPFERIDSNCSPISVFVDELYFLVGFNSEVSDYLTRCIIVGGGQISQVLCQEVTYVVVSEDCRNNRQYNSILSEIRRHPVGVVCVNLLFVMESLFTLRRITPLLEDPKQGSSASVTAAATSEGFQCRIPGYSIDFSAVECVDDLVDCTKYIAKQPSVEPGPVPAATAVGVEELFTEAPLTTTMMKPPKLTAEKKRGGGGGGGNFLKDFQNKRKLTQLTGAMAPAAPISVVAGGGAVTASSDGFAVPSGGPSTRTRLTRSHNLNDESQVVTYGDSEHRY